MNTAPMLFRRKEEQYAGTSYKACPLYQRYTEARRGYLGEARREKWRREQKQELSDVVDEAFMEIGEEDHIYWKKRVLKYFEKRFHGIVKTQWTIFLADLNDHQASAGLKQEKMQQYVLMVRNAARSRHRKEMETVVKTHIRRITLDDVVLKLAEKEKKEAYAG